VHRKRVARNANITTVAMAVVGAAASVPVTLRGESGVTRLLSQRVEWRWTGARRVVTESRPAGIDRRRTDRWPLHWPPRSAGHWRRHAAKMDELQQRRRRRRQMRRNRCVSDAFSIRQRTRLLQRRFVRVVLRVRLRRRLSVCLRVCVCARGATHWNHDRQLIYAPYPSAVGASDIAALTVSPAECDVGVGWQPRTGTQPWLKSWGEPRFWARSKAGLGVGCERGSPPPAVRIRGNPPENFWKLIC